jgi:hypothetical protein
MEQKILEARTKLYSLLLQLDDYELTDNEVDLLYSLSKDKQIKELLNER